MFKLKEAIKEEKKQHRCDVCTKLMQYDGRCWQCRWLLNDDDDDENEEGSYNEQEAERASVRIVRRPRGAADLWPNEGKDGRP